MTRMVFSAALLVAWAASLAASAAPDDPARANPASRQTERGKYLVKIAGCNDCHTPGYAQTGGKVPETLWLTGDKLGWRGPWGTTYAANLRIYMASLTESQWVQRAKTMQTRPPMPWFALRDMSEQDLKALYHYVRSLGAGGEAAPVYVSAGNEPRTPYVQFPAPPK